MYYGSPRALYFMDDPIEGKKWQICFLPYIPDSGSLPTSSTDGRKELTSCTLWLLFKQVWGLQMNDYGIGWVYFTGNYTLSITHYKLYYQDVTGQCPRQCLMIPFLSWDLFKEGHTLWVPWKHLSNASSANILHVLIELWSFHFYTMLRMFQRW